VTLQHLQLLPVLQADNIIREGSCWVPGWWLWRGSAEARSLI
jgi:hypothetical protein